MLGALICLLGSIESHTFQFIASVDAVVFVVSIVAALSVYLATDPVKGQCLGRAEDMNYSMSTTHTIELFVIFSLVIFQLFLNDLGIWRLVRYAFRPVLRLLGVHYEPQREPDIIKTIVLKFFDRWALMLVCNLFLWTNAEYTDYKDYRTALFGMLSTYLRVTAVYGFVSDCYKVFCGQLKGDRLRDDNFHSGISLFRERWSHLWQYELFFVASFLVYFLALLFFYGEDQSGLPAFFTNYAHLLSLALNGFILISLVDLLDNAKKYEIEIRRYCYKLTQVLQKVDGSGAKITYSTIYLSISRLFDVIKMAMFTEYVAIILCGIPVVQIGFPTYKPNPVGMTAAFVLGWGTPIIYEMIARLLNLNKLRRLSHENVRDFFVSALSWNTATWDAQQVQQVAGSSKETQRTRQYFVFFAMFVAYLSLAVMGAFRGCNKVEYLIEEGTIDSSKASGSNTLFVYIAKSFAIPTTLGFGLVFVTSPAAARYSDSWVNLPFLLKILLAPMPWLTPHLMNQMHIACGAVFFCGGFYHGLCWISIFIAQYLTKATNGILVAVLTGSCMILCAVKLLWPPGMDGYSVICEKRDNKFIYRLLLKVFQLSKIDKFLMNSKYGSVHVYLALFVFTLYMVHGTVNLYPMYLYYWAFPVSAWATLFILHPAKATYVSLYIESFRSSNGYSRRYNVVEKAIEPLRKGALTMVHLTIKLPTYDAHFSEVYNRRGTQRYEGFCDVIMIKLRPWRKVAPEGKDGGALLAPNPGFCERAARELETVHYYSVVSIVSENDADNPTVKASLMIQNTDRPDGSSASLIRDPSEDPNNTGFEVVGFVKSNALDTIHAPRVIAFGWESGAAAFCSLFQRRAEYVYSEFAEGNTFVYNKDLFVVWSAFCKRCKSYNVDALLDILRENASIQRNLYNSSSAKGCDEEGAQYVRPKIIVIYTSVPKEFTPIREHPAGLVPADEEAVERTITSVHSSSDSSNPFVQGILADHMATFPDGTPSRWLSIRTAFARGLQHPECTGNFGRVIQSAVSSLYQGKDICSLYIPAHENTDRAISEYKYEAIYDTINKYILEVQVQFQKNPQEALKLCNEALANKTRMADPETSYEIAVDVLYSGEYSSGKLDQLRSVVESVRDSQVFTRVPATLSFVPDA